MNVFEISSDYSGKNINASHIVSEAFLKLKESGGGLISFEKGEYHFYKDGTFKQFFAVSNNVACDKYIVFPIIDFDGLTIDGNGSVFIFHEVVFPFIVHNSNNVVIKNIITDCAASPVAMFKVRDITDKGFFMDFDKEKQPFYVKDGGLVYKREYGEVSGLERLFSLHSTERVCIEFWLTGNSSASTKNLPVGCMITDVSEAENGIYVSYRDNTYDKCIFNEGEVLSSVVDGGRNVDVIFLSESENIKVQNLVVRRGIGMGIIGQLCRNIEIDGFSTDREYHGECSTLTADSLHFINCDGKLEIHNCSISDTMDDVINVHGIYTELKTFKDFEIIAELKHHEQYFFNPYRSGDRLELINPDSLEVVSEFVVEKSEFLDNSGKKLKLSGSFTYGKEKTEAGCLIENPDKMSELHLYNNRFLNFPHMRISGGGNIVIENNRLENASAAMLALDLAKYWYESGRINNLVFRNNYMNNCNGQGGESFITIGIDGVENKLAPKIHKRIEISENVFENIKKYAVVAGGVENLVIEKNDFKTDKTEIIRENF